jgi:hypothetical protein
MEEPACIGGRLISPRPARPRRQEPQIVAALGELDRDALQDARHLHERAAILGRLDQVARGLQVDSGDIG